jgi:F-type H+-transporting ATPase subunit epsilon
MATLLVEIVTPEVALWSGEATALLARSSEGQFTILPEHTPLVGNIVPGVVRVATASGELSFLVHGGFFQVGRGDEEGVTRATVLAGVAERLEDVDLARAQVAKETVEATLASLGDEDEGERAEALAALARADTRLRVRTTTSK